MDQDGVDAEIEYPTPRVSLSLFWNTADPELHVAQIRAYNDWLSEFCGYDPDRLAGVALIPNVGVEAAIEELHRALKLPGIRGASIGQYPGGELDPSRDDDSFWAAVQGAEVPLSVHVSFAYAAPGDHKRLIGGGLFRFFDAAIRSAQFVESGILDRFPRLKLVFAEVECGWVPHVKEQMDIRYRIRNPKEMAPIRLRPSEYFDRNMSFVFITDPYGIANRHRVGVERMLWSSDYPHTSTEWPESWKAIERDFAGVPEDERHPILAGNAVRLYGFPAAGGQGQAPVGAGKARA